MKKETLTALLKIRLTKEEHDRLKRVCAMRGVTVSKCLRELIKKLLTPN